MNQKDYLKMDIHNPTDSSQNKHNCRLCDSDDLYYSTYPSSDDNVKTLGINGIYCCRQCGFGWANPLPDPEKLDNFYNSGSYWGPSSQSHQLQVHNKVQAYFRVKYLSKLLSRSGIDRHKPINILDVGAGLGDIRFALNKIFPDLKINYDFIESDSTMANNILLKSESTATRHVKVTELNSDYYDIIFLNHVLEHVSDPIEFLHLFKKSLKKSGLCYVETPNQDHKFKSNVFPHTLFFSSTSLQKLAAKVDFNVIAARTFGNRATASEPKNRSHWNRLISRIFASTTRFDSFKIHRFTNNLAFGYERNGGLWTSVVLQ
jgi:2-polyprenyl-3-methyl-5-hydroxy-6-metoxy-1,4-benzoquinol methylase